MTILFYIELYNKDTGENILQSKAYDTAEEVYIFLQQFQYIEVGPKYGLAFMPICVKEEDEYEVLYGEHIQPNIALQDLKTLCEKYNKQMED